MEEEKKSERKALQELVGGGKGLHCLPIPEFLSLPSTVTF